VKGLRISYRNFVKSSSGVQQVKAIAIKKQWTYTIFFSLQEMGVLRCDVCGEEFAIGHPPHAADRNTAERQAYWLERVLAEDHEREKRHDDRIELPDWGYGRQEKKPA
jgi:hypothetical protein